MQQALANSRSGDEIWVAAGEYKPSEMTSPPNNGSKTFQLLEGRMSMKAGELERAKGFYELFLEIVGPEDYRVERVEAELEKIDAML